MKFRHRLVVLALLCTVLALLAAPTLAQTIPPSIKVAPIWSPSRVLTSLDNVAPFGTFPSEDNDGNYEPGTDDDEVNYAEARILVTTTVQFWAVQMTCTINKALLEPYTPFGGATDNPGDDRPIVSLDSTPWGMGSASTLPTYNPTTGVLGFAITKLGNQEPMGRNGQSDTFLLATLRFRVKTQLPAFTTGTSPLTCTSIFLNRNGGVVIAPTYTPPTPLNVTAGFLISGIVTYQGRTAHGGIGVYCDSSDNSYNPLVPGPGDKTAVTAANGSFVITGIRTMNEWYRCFYFGNASTASAPAWVNDADTYVTGSQWVNPTDKSIQLLPVMLLNGNVDRTVDTGGDPDPTQYNITDGDLGLVTGNYGVLNTITAYTLGDATGDKKVDQVDLALVGANLWRAPVDNGAFPYTRAEGVDNGHLLAGLSATVYGDSRTYMTVDPMQPDGTYAAVQLVPGTAKTYWPALSPDGTKIAFIRQEGNWSVNQSAPNPPITRPRYVLFVAPIVNGAAGAPVRMTPVTGWNFDDFAPSWSPDGQRIAFNCSPINIWNPGTNWAGIGREWQNDFSEICLVDATGRNLAQKTGNRPARIYPPAWRNNDSLLFGGNFNANFGMDTCANTICQLEVNNGYIHLFDGAIPANPAPPNSPLDIADMPSIGYPHSSGNYDTRLVFYRFYDSAAGERTLRVFTLEGGAGYPDDIGPDYHMDVLYDSDPGAGVTLEPLTTRLDYYSLQWNVNNIIYSEYDDPGGYGGSGCNFRWLPLITQEPIPPQWADRNFFGQFNIIAWNHCNPWWNGSYDNNTDWGQGDLFGLRKVIVSVP